MVELDKDDIKKLKALLEITKVSIDAGLQRRPNLMVKRKLKQLDKALLEINEKLNVSQDIELDEDKYLNTNKFINNKNP